MARRVGAGQQQQRRAHGVASLLAAAVASVSAQSNNTGAGASTPNTGLASVNATARGNTWAVVGAPQVSAQQLFRGQGNKVGCIISLESLGTLYLHAFTLH